MSPLATQSILNPALPDTEVSHRRRLQMGYTAALALLVALTVYGFDYYLLDLLQRPFSPKHPYFRPSGFVGLWLGILGTAMFFVIFLYPIRKRWDWLRRIGNTRHWLDFHVLLGLTAPLIIAFHASFKFRGIAGMAFWIMSAVAMSGIAGRYLYAQIPRSLSAAELSLKEVEDLLAETGQRLAAQKLIPSAVLTSLFSLPSSEEVKEEGMIRAFASMLALDLKRALGVAHLRRRACAGGGKLLTLGGLLSSNNKDLERVIEVAQEQAALSKRILFLNRSQQVFHLWHVVHKPFSYSFLVLACLHILVVLLFGVR
jgi:hypothetical protein